jgi:ribonuclease D
LARAEALKQWRKLKALKLEVESDIILPRDLLSLLASKNPMDMTTLKECLQDVPWRRKHYGEEILKVLWKVEGKPET